MADLLHVNAMQQLEVALLGPPAAQVIDLLSGRWIQTKPLPMTTSVQPHPQAYTLTLLAPAPTSVPILGVSSPVSTVSMPSGEGPAMVTESQDVPMSIPKCH